MRFFYFFQSCLNSTRPPLGRWESCYVTASTPAYTTWREETPLDLHFYIQLHTGTWTIQDFEQQGKHRRFSGEDNDIWVPAWCQPEWLGKIPSGAIGRPFLAYLASLSAWRKRLCYFCNYFTQTAATGMPSLYRDSAFSDLFTINKFNSAGPFKTGKEHYELLRGKRTLR